MVLVTQNTLGGLGRGIEQAGQSLGGGLQNALQQAAKNRIQGAQGQAASQAVGPETLLGKILQVPGGIELASKLGGILGPLAKEEAQQGSAGGFFNQYKPQQTDTPSNETPIALSRQSPNVEVEEGGEISTPAGIFKEEEIVDIPGFGKLPRSAISDALTNPNQRIQKWGEGAQKALEAKEKEERKKFVSDRAFHTENTKKDRERAEELRTSIPKTSQALRLAERAIKSGKVGAFSKANLSQILGGEAGKAFQTSEGISLLNAGKEFLINNLSRLSARSQNQWIEQRINSQFPNIGQSKEANLTASEALQAENLLDQAYLNTFDRLANEDRKKYGYIRDGIAQRTTEQIKDLEQQIVDRSAYRIQKQREAQTDRNPIRVTSQQVEEGRPLTLETLQMFVNRYGKEKAIQSAASLGYKIPTREEIDFNLKSFDDVLK